MTTEQELESATRKVWADPLHWRKLANEKSRAVSPLPLYPLNGTERLENWARFSSRVTPLRG